MANLIDGKILAAEIRGRVKEEVSVFTAETGVVPSLATVLVGEDPASQTYVRGKRRAARKAGMKSTTELLPADIPEAELLALVSRLNRDPEVHGILVQLPLPAHINVEGVVAAISPLKDVDAFHPENLGLLFRGCPRFLPCTPAGVIHALESLGLSLAGKSAVVIGRSLIVGKPMALLLLEKHMTVTVCHSRTVDLPQVVGRADVVVAAVGRAEMVKGDWLREGAVVIDVGMNTTEDGRLVGDVDFEAACRRAGYITPVPGGVGRLTIAMLMKNVLTAARLAQSGASSASSK